VVAEANNRFGSAYIKWLKRLGVNLWIDRKTGKPWWTDDRTKHMLLDYAKLVIDKEYATVNDPITVQELQAIREQADGKIEADAGVNDDRAMALFLALWGGRRLFSRGRKQSVKRELKALRDQRERRHRELGVA
jgi:hypothetical protein